VCVWVGGWRGVVVLVLRFEFSLCVCVCVLEGRGCVGRGLGWGGRGVHPNQTVQRKQERHRHRHHQPFHPSSMHSTHPLIHSLIHPSNSLISIRPSTNLEVRQPRTHRRPRRVELGGGSEARLQEARGLFEEFVKGEEAGQLVQYGVEGCEAGGVYVCECV
jgi:hypothetical protein